MNANVAGETVSKLVPGASLEFANTSNEQLLEGTRRLVGRSNQVLAALLAHLGEVEARGIFRKCSCVSLYTYCIYELRFSEDEAARRATAAKLVRRFPALLESVARGELHLTGLLMLGPLLTEQNIVEVLGRAKFRTKKELGKLVRTLAPLPRVPDRVEPLGPELPRTPRNPTWAEFVESLCPPIRQLPPGKRPADWANDTTADDIGAPPSADVTPPPLPPLTEPQLYLMQFTASEEHVQLVERAKALLPRDDVKSLAELHLQAMRLLVTALEKKRFGAPRPRPSAPSDERPRQRGSAAGAADAEHPRQRGSADDAEAEHPRQRGSELQTEKSAHAAPPERSRYIPADVRREVFERDEARCTYIDDRGVRCRETDALQFHHLDAFGKGGPSVAANVTLRCHAHNALAAEQDFGSEHMAHKRDEQCHESLRKVARETADEDG